MMAALLSSVLFLLSLAFAALITFSIVRGSRNKYVAATSTVIHSFSIQTEASGEPYIHVVGRHKGVLAWILSSLNIENTVELTVTEKDWALRDASLSGMRVEYLPLKNVGASICGYQRSQFALFFSLLFGLLSAGRMIGTLPDVVDFLKTHSEAIREATATQLASDFASILLWSVLCGIAFLFYYTSKRVAFGVRSDGAVAGILFKRSLLENKVIDLAEAERATSIINQLFAAAVYGIPVSQVPRRGVPGSTSGDTGTPWGWIAGATYLTLICLAVGLGWYGRGVKVEVTTNPVGAPVFEDGNYIGSTSKDAAILLLTKTTREAHTFVSRLDGYEVLESKVKIGGLRSTQDVALKLISLKFPLTLYTSPAGARVTLDGKDAGASDTAGKIVIPDVKHGTHQITVSSDGYQTKSSPIEIYSSPRSIWITLVNEAQAAQQQGEARAQEINAHLDRARILFRQGQYQQAVDECDAVLKIDPSNSAAISLKSQIEQTRKVLGQ